MINTKSSNFDLMNLVSYLLILLYFFIGFVPNLEAVDRIAPQWLAMNLLNFISLFVFIYNRKSIKETIYKVLTSKLSLFYIGFIFWAGLSYFYAINPTEVIVNITRQVNVLIMFFSMAILLFNLKNKAYFISWTLSMILSVEIYAVLVDAIEMININGFIIPNSLKGVTANRNITAFSIGLKIPFALYLIRILKKKTFKILLTILVFLAITCLTMIQSRASFIALGLIIVGFSSIQAVIYIKYTRSLKTLLSIGYILIPFLLAIIFNQTLIANRGADAISRAATISLLTEDASIKQRLRYYDDVITHIFSNPILGTGLGNWKIKSIEYDSENINGYVVPYHAHNDFIQLGAELGIIGFLLYLGIFLWAVYYVFVFVRHSSSNIDEKTFVFLLLVVLGVYFIDANLNFPIARPQEIVVWTAIMALIVSYYQNYKVAIIYIKIKNILTPIFLIIIFIFLLPSLYFTSKVYESLKGQMFLLKDFNSNKYDLPLNKVENVVPDIPNITVTTLPINSVRARYYLNAKQYDKALELAEKGISANPYIFYSEFLLSEIYMEKGDLDKAKYYAKKAFLGLPNNSLHTAHYLNLIAKTRDKDALEKIFERLITKNDINNWKNYLLLAGRLYPARDSILIERAKKAKGLFPSNPDIQGLFQQITLGVDKVNKASQFSNKGLEYYSKNDFESSVQEFEKAAEANPLDYAHLENAATANYMIGNLEKAIQQIDVVINDLNPLNGKCEYIKALIYIKMGDPVGACPLLNIAIDSGFTPAEATFKEYCR